MSAVTKLPDKARNARLEARLPGDRKAFFQRASGLTGQTLNEFVIDSTQKAATNVSSGTR